MYFAMAHGWDDGLVFKYVFVPFNRRSRVRAVVSRGSTGLVGQNTSCKAHKVCISLWPTDGMTYSAVKPID